MWLVDLVPVVGHGASPNVEDDPHGMKRKVCDSAAEYWWFVN